MDADYRRKLTETIDAAFAKHPEFTDHRMDDPWLIGALGSPTAPVWFLAENPSLGMVRRAAAPGGGPVTEEAQWYASEGDRLFRRLPAKHGFKRSPPDAPGGWNCYLTNVIKVADYAEKWRKRSAAAQRRAIEAWAEVLRWEMAQGNPALVVALGKIVEGHISHLRQLGLQFPRVERVHHYSYVALRPQGRLGPMHPDRVEEYDEQFRRVASIAAELGSDTASA